MELESAIGLTTFAHPKKEMGKTVAIQLLKLMENPSLNVSVKFPPNLVERESVKHFKASHMTRFFIEKYYRKIKENK